MDPIYKSLLGTVDKGYFPNLKKITINTPGFRRNAWNVFPWASRVWHRRLAAKGIQFFDEEGELNHPESDDCFGETYNENILKLQS